MVLVVDLESVKAASTSVAEDLHQGGNAVVWGTCKPEHALAVVMRLYRLADASVGHLPGTLIAASELGFSSSLVSSLAKDALHHAGDVSVRTQLLKPKLRLMLLKALSPPGCESCLRELTHWWDLQS
jgi:hypothetical protein